MITSLRLEKFGKFINKTFRFNPVTLFTGNNETGKTTLFDALLHVLAPPKSTTTSGKRLVMRYGKDRQAHAEYDEAPLELSAEDFLNLFAVRSSDISLEIEKNSQWMNHVKASLFSGGIDPQIVIDELEAVIKGKGKNSLQIEAKRIKEEQKSIQLELEETRERRRECLNEEKRATDSNSRVNQTSAEIKKLTADVAEIEKIIEQQNLIREEKTLKDILFRAAENRRKKEELEKYSRYSHDRLGELKKKEAAVSTLKTEAEKSRILMEEALRGIQRYIEEKSRREKVKIRAESLRALANELRDSLLPREKLIKRRIIRLVKKPFLAAGAADLLAGVAAAFFATSTTFTMAALGIGTVTCCLFFVFSFRHQSVEDTSDLEAVLTKVRERWHRETGEIPEESYEAVLAILDRAFTLARAAIEDYEQIASQTADFEKEAATRSLQKKKTEADYESAVSDVRRFLEEAQAVDATDYATRLGKKEHLTVQLAEQETKLCAAQETYLASSQGELEDILTRKCDEINDKITQTELGSQELRAKENDLKEKKARLEALRREEKQNIGDIRLNLGTARGKMAGLPEKIIACEKAIHDNESRLAEINKELYAARIAQEIFKDIAGDSDEKLKVLSSDISSTFSALTEEGRQVSLKAYSTEKAEVIDSGGEERDEEYLSAGTRDAFLLAARLVLARKSQDSGKKCVIVLDEPFLTLDRPRIKRALAVLKEFRQKEGWQIIIFTKDEKMEEQARAVFGAELLVHNLE